MAKGRPDPRPGILEIEAYVPGKSALADGGPVMKLSSNENPFGASPKALEAYELAAKKLEVYPDGSARRLREAIAGVYGLEADRIVCGAGSDDILNLLAQAYLGPGDEAIYTEHGFLVYRIVILARGATPVIAPESGLTADVDAILARVTERTRVVYIANPNNPTGTYLSASEMQRLRDGLPDDVLLVIDAAYAEYAMKDDYEAGIAMVRDSGNTVMTRTFSKIYGLAALRVGWSYCPAEIASVLNRIRGPFNVSGPGIAAGTAAIEDSAFMEKSATHNAVWRERLTASLEQSGLKVTPSAANFLLVHFPDRPGESAADADAFLHSRRIIARRMESYGLPHALRISIGTEEQNLAVAEALRDFVQGAESEAPKKGAGVA